MYRYLRILLIIVVLVGQGLWSSAQNYTIEKWYNGKKSATVLTFDDWSPGQHLAVPALSSRGLVGSFYITINNVNNWTPINNAAQQGNEIGNHTRSHPHLSSLSATQLTQEITDAKTTLQNQLPGVKVETFVYPHGDYNDAVIAEVKKQHFAARAYVEPVPVNISFPYEFSATWKDYFTVNTVPVDANLNPTLFGNRVQQGINSNGLLTFTIHSIYNASVNDNWWDPISETHLNQLLDKLLTYSNQTWITTFSNAVKYHKEKHAASLSTVSNNTNEWIVNLTDTLSNNALYNHPLTIKLKIGTGETYSSVVQNGISIPFTLTTANDSIVFNAIPDGGNIYINKGVGITLTVNSPANNSSFQGLNAIALSANATISGASISNVTFSVNGQSFVVTNGNPYTASWTPSAYGTYTIAISAQSSNGKTAQTSVTVSVNEVPTCTTPAWVASNAYNGNTEVSYDGNKYKSNWWTQNERPDLYSGAGKPWAFLEPCSSGTNQKPVVSITSPVNNATYNNLNAISISSNANDADGSVVSVKYSFTGQADKVITGSNPFTTSFIPPANGTYTITAVAKDNLGLESTPYSITVTVNPPTVNQKPTVSITSPANNTTYNNLNAISISANASDADGSIASVKYSFTGQVDKVITGSNPFTTSFTPAAYGTYTITAVAKDNVGLESNPTSITISVNETSTCTAAQYQENGNYVAGSKVKNGGILYECKPYPFTGWCNGAAWAYAPGSGAVWQDAWISLGNCTLRKGAMSSSAAVFNLYPNPTEGKISITLLSEGVTSLKVSVINNLDIEVLNTEISQEEQLDISSLSNGIYTIRIVSGEQVWVERVVKK